MKRKLTKMWKKGSNIQVSDLSLILILLPDVYENMFEVKIILKLIK